MGTQGVGTKAADAAQETKGASLESLPDVVMSLRLEGAMHDALRKLAFDERKPMRDYIVRGIEMVLKAEKR